MDLIERPEHVGRRHPWEVARARFFVRLLERTGVLADAAGLGGVLDVGAGDAWLAEQLRAVLAPEARLACWDIHYPDDPVVGQPARGEAEVNGQTASFLLRERVRLAAGQ